MDLNKQISENRKKFRVDHFDIVVSEYINRYNDGKLILNPPYQRKFRWDTETQSALIESILIGIPLPPIFVFSNNNYEWEIIDGLQRTTTLIKFLNNFSEGAAVFDGCQILTELNGKRLSDLPSSVVNAVNNARLRIELVEDNDDAYSQYLLFSRLNNNGESLSSQELRNFLIYKLNHDFYKVITTNLKDFNSFKLVMDLPSDRTDKQEDVEYIVRFFICKKVMQSSQYNKSQYKKIDDILTSEIQDYLKNTTTEQLTVEYELFKSTFDFINKLQKGYSYKAFHKGLNSLPNASVIAPAISTNLQAYISSDTDVTINKILDFYSSSSYKKITSQSYNPVKRFFELSLYAYRYFNDIIEDIK